MGKWVVAAGSWDAFCGSSDDMRSDGTRPLEVSGHGCIMHHACMAGKSYTIVISNPSISQPQTGLRTEDPAGRGGKLTKRVHVLTSCSGWSGSCAVRRGSHRPKPGAHTREFRAAPCQQTWAGINPAQKAFSRAPGLNSDKSCTEAAKRHAGPRQLSAGAMVHGMLPVLLSDLSGAGCSRDDRCLVAARRIGRYQEGDRTPPTLASRLDLWSITNNARWWCNAVLERRGTESHPSARHCRRALHVRCPRPLLGRAWTCLDCSAFGWTPHLEQGASMLLLIMSEFPLSEVRCWRNSCDPVRIAQVCGLSWDMRSLRALRPNSITG